MNEAAEALEFGVGVFRFMDKSLFVAFLLMTAYSMWITVSLIDARHQLRAMRGEVPTSLVVQH